MKSYWYKFSLLFLFIVAVIGTLLRASHLLPSFLRYDHLVHAHSHVAFQGWIYSLMILLLTKTFLTESQIQKGKYPLQFTLTVILIVGVLISFSLQGYALYSIIFSTLFQLMNYWFIYSFFRDTKNHKTNSVSHISLRFIKTGLWLGLISTLVPIAVGYLAAQGQANSEAYQSFVYTFLHLQYNGWFLFVALGLFFKLLEKYGATYNLKMVNRFYWLFTFAVVPAIALSLLGMSYSKLVIVPALIAAILQTIGLVFLLSHSSSAILIPKAGNRWVKAFCWLFLCSFIIKIVLQNLSVFPVFEPLAFQNKLIILAYLHLNFIGVISFLFIGLLFDLQWLGVNKISVMGAYLLIAGFLFSEFALVVTGMGLANLHGLLLLASTSMALGILLLIMSPAKVAGENLSRL